MFPRTTMTIVVLVQSFEELLCVLAGAIAAPDVQEPLPPLPAGPCGPMMFAATLPQAPDAFGPYTSPLDELRYMSPLTPVPELGTPDPTNQDED